MLLHSDSLTEMRNAVRDWVEMLAHSRFDDAANAVASSESQCSASILREAIGRYSRRFREASADDKWQFFPVITSPTEIDTQGENMVVYVKRNMATIEYDLPIAGQWSDLTAKFCVEKTEPSGFELSLTDIRVL